MSSGTETQRQLVRQHLMKLRRAIEQAIAENLGRVYELPLGATIAMENTMIAVYQEAALLGRREGYLVGLEAGRQGSIRPGPIGQSGFAPRGEDTPTRPSTPWRGPKKQP